MLFSQMNRVTLFFCISPTHQLVLLFAIALLSQSISLNRWTFHHQNTFSASPNKWTFCQRMPQYLWKETHCLRGKCCGKVGRSIPVWWSDHQFVKGLLCQHRFFHRRLVSLAVSVLDGFKLRGVNNGQDLFVWLKFMTSVVTGILAESSVRFCELYYMFMWVPGWYGNHLFGLFQPLGVTTIVTLGIQLLLWPRCVFCFALFFSISLLDAFLSKGRCGILNVRSNLRVCCAHESGTGAGKHVDSKEQKKTVPCPPFKTRASFFCWQNRTDLGKCTHLYDKTQGNTSAFDRKLSSSSARR